MIGHYITWIGPSMKVLYKPLLIFLLTCPRMTQSWIQSQGNELVLFDDGYNKARRGTI